ncbi:MAG TPA: succinate dehydrogenase cytochrome b subunit [Bacteroidales bacterium]|nr:succinate dehydrogenase cytochrome b subunit [Bacteroidales bacterium]
MSNLLVYSSITKKIIMGAFGLFLALFLLVHLTINLLLIAGDGGKMFTAASDFMTTNILIKIFEYVLFGGILIHMLIGVILTIKNWASRPVRYHVVNKSQTEFFSKYMIYTGAIIMIFLLLHFMHFFFIKMGWVQPPAGVDTHNFYLMAILLFQNKAYSFIYIAFFIFLGFHLNHAILSGFQTFGLNHSKYNKTIKIVSMIYALVVTVGFSIIPIYFMFFFK